MEKKRERKGHAILINNILMCSIERNKYSRSEDINVAGGALLDGNFEVISHLFLDPKNSYALGHDIPAFLPYTTIGAIRTEQ